MPSILENKTFNAKISFNFNPLKNSFVEREKVTVFNGKIPLEKKISNNNKNMNKKSILQTP
jgi:hypothetical protein